MASVSKQPMGQRPQKPSRVSRDHCEINDLRLAQRATTAMVEMGGIEPPSIAEDLRLLRAQLVKAFYSAPTFATSIQVDEPSLSESPANP